MNEFEQQRMVKAIRHSIEHPRTSAQIWATVKAQISRGDYARMWPRKSAYSALDSVYQLLMQIGGRDA
jgi:hypothetical protein